MGWVLSVLRRRTGASVFYQVGYDADRSAHVSAVRSGVAVGAEAVVVAAHVGGGAMTGDAEAFIEWLAERAAEYPTVGVLYYADDHWQKRVIPGYGFRAFVAELQEATGAAHIGGITPGGSV
jgi:hypothetical protein